MQEKAGVPGTVEKPIRVVNLLRSLGQSLKREEVQVLAMEMDLDK